MVVGAGVRQILAGDEGTVALPETKTFSIVDALDSPVFSRPRNLRTLGDIRSLCSPHSSKSLKRHALLT